MTTTTAEKSPTLTETWAALEPRVEQLGPDWFKPTRRAAIARFLERGLPTGSDEQWRFTNIARIRETSFSLASEPVAVKPSDVAAATIPGLDAIQLVFVDGQFQPGLSSELRLPKGVRVLSLAEALHSEQELIERYFGKLADPGEQAFTDLNTALADEGVVITVDKNARADDPIHVLNIASGGEQPLLYNPRNLIVADDGAEVTVVEDYVSLGRGVYLTNAVTEIYAGDNAKVSHYLIERESVNAFNISSLHAKQGRDSQFASHSALLGGAIVRNNVNPILDGENGDSLLNGLYVPSDGQTMDNHMRVDHAKPHCDSRQFYKGVMSGASLGVFRGRIVVRQVAQKTDAKQSNQILLMSDDASANTDPQLEIYADDVKCTHGATIGQINEDQVFYLRSRGIPTDTARAMIVYAFAAESLERMENDAIKAFLTEQLLEILPAGNAFGHAQ